MWGLESTSRLVFRDVSGSDSSEGLGFQEIAPVLSSSEASPTAEGVNIVAPVRNQSVGDPRDESGYEHSEDYASPATVVKDFQKSGSIDQS